MSLYSDDLSIRVDSTSKPNLQYSVATTQYFTDCPFTFENINVHLAEGNSHPLHLHY